MLFQVNKNKKISNSTSNIILDFTFLFSIHLIFFLPAYIINLPAAITFNIYIIFLLFVFFIFVLKNFNLYNLWNNKLFL